MFVKIENWDDGTPLILNTDNIKAIHHYMGESKLLKDYYTVDFSNTCYYHITNQGIVRIEKFKDEWLEIVSIYKFVTREDNIDE